MLPSRFIELNCLQELDLQGSETLQEITNDFHHLVALRKLNMFNCWSLSRLPQGFGKLGCLEELVLSGCDKLEELSSDFHCVRALRKLDLSGCNTLLKLPNRFGHLGCLEVLDLSRCSQLEHLSANFHCLPSLIRLELSYCERLNGKWMDSVGCIESLWRETRRALLLKAIISKFFSEIGILVDTHQHPFCLSSLPPDISVILIISMHDIEPLIWELLEKNIQRLESNCKVFKIIYVGKAFSALPTKLINRILACTPNNSRASFFFDKLFTSKFRTYEPLVFYSTDSLQEKGLKCFSVWEDISYILNEVCFLLRTPRESNIELLRALLVTAETDFLLLNNKQQVKVNDLQGKLILFLITTINIAETQTSALKDMYPKMLARHDHLAEVGWIPRVDWGRPTWVEYERCAENSPWPVVPNPWLINTISLYHLTNAATALVVVDAKGRISCKDAMPMIERWGVEAYPFFQSHEEELRKVEWEGLKVQSSVQFVFQNLDSTQMKVQLLYLGRKPICIWMDAQEEAVYEMKRKAMSTIPNLSFLDAYKFWQHVVYLYNDLSRMRADEKTVKVRKLLLGLLNQTNRDVCLIVVGENGEVVTGRGKEVIEVLWKGGKDEEEMLCDVKREGLRQVLERRWKDGIVSNTLYQ
ncbi:hypothetical protein KI387_034283 [Taxus chinensis]|uniref:Uncharacterized protein n=1 Tax=Taxus chinensis TaxID=29808 RepID=A0AA38BWV1_TAXCH|nr:hypothetical protein KI387_034283 [Taxus chinensis]